MKEKLNILRGRPWLVMLTAALFAWLLPQTAAAEEYLHDTDHYSVSLGGTNIVYFTAPVYDQKNVDQWIEEGRLFCKPEGESEFECFFWKTNETDISGSRTWVRTYFSTSAGGFFDITKGNTRDVFRLTKDNAGTADVNRNSDEYSFSFEAEWVVPYSLLGKKLTFTWEVYRNGNSPWKRTKVTGLKTVEIKMPAASAKLTPFLSNPMMDPNSPGKVQLPWFLASDKITKAYYEYRDVADKYYKVDIKDMNSGVIMLDATMPHKGLRVICNYKEKGDKGEYEIEGVGSSSLNVPIIHAPVGLRARPLNDRTPKVELTWSLPYPDTEDLTPTDFFEIQRSLTGKEEDFKTISSSTFYAQNDRKTQYTYVDSTLLEAIQTSMLVNGGTLPNLTYRVRRAITQNWGWGANNNCAATASCVMDNLHLLRIKDYSARWEDEKAYTVRVSWQYADEHGAVWDDRAKMVLRVISKNREGAIVDSLIYTIDDATERAQRYKIVNLTRSCVSYDIDMYVERNQSPINQLADLTQDFFPIRSFDDWQEFSRRVEAANGQYDLNARLYADITVNTILGWKEGSPYRGIFDGNGHTLTVSYKGSDNSAYNSENIAPFRYVSNATIKNLYVKGTISTNSKFEAGLIAQVKSGGTVTIESCRSSVTLNSSVNGDATNGGLVAVVNSNATVKFSTCKFDGSFEGANCHSNGGFVGWTYGKVTIDNSLFAPDHFSTKLEGCATWSRLHPNATLTVTNSYATTEVSDQIASMVIDGKTFMVLHNENDWLKFRDAVDNNSNTNAILANNFTVHNAVALSAGKVFSGIFDGNGHTLNVDMDGGNAEKIALFCNGKQYTIKNLHITGKITGGKHTAGLMGYSDDWNGSSKILNCRVSASIEADDFTGGGFCGTGNGVDIVNCLFDGSLWCKQAISSDPKKDNYAGAFFGFTWTPSSSEIAMCLQTSLEKGTFTNINILGMNAAAWKTWGNGETAYSFKNYTYNNLPGGISVGSLSASDLVGKLGSDNWQVVGGLAVPKMTTTEVGKVTHPLSDFEAYYVDGWTKEGNTINPTVTSEAYQGYATINDPNLKGLFYHKNTGTIDQTLLTQTRQSSVLLTWKTDNNPIDYFRVMRRVKGQGEDKWQEVATDLTDISYEDTSVSPLMTYEYKVQAVNDCEGINMTETQVKVGECKHTGRVEGYVRFNDGTGAPAVWVVVNYSGNEVTRVETDESGYFEVDGLSYQGGTKVDYSVGPAAESGISIPPMQVTFDAKSNNETLREFTIENGRRFSGYVMYEGTSIPVKGVNFLVDGNRIHNAQGRYVETDYDGSFSFRVLHGQHTIQAVMDKHVFTNGGWYKNSNKQNLTADQAGIYFYDATKVKLTGRIVGGDDQGKKPLMNNLSMNNLGDSLTMVLTLEGDNTSWLVYDNQHPNRTEREEVVRHQRGGDKHYTSVKTMTKRMVVWPDATTGEYTLMLPPVRWKVQQVYCKGYPTLFQEEQVSEVIDLTDCLDEQTVAYDGTYYDADEVRVEKPTATYHAVYNRIYHSPVEVTYKQVGFDNFDYFGDKTYAASELTGETVQVPLVYSVRKPNWPSNRKDSLKAVYTLGHPVFSVERKYNIQLQVAERYRYNNDPLGRVDMVPLKGGTAYMQNGMRGLSLDDLTTIKEPQQLDSLGQCVFTLKADQTSNMANCLRTVTFTVERDSTYIQAEPLQAYVLNMFPVGAGQDIMTDGAPTLYDILRDPPGAYSSNTLAKGATINYTYMMSLSLAAGPVATVKYGEKLQTVTATVAAPQGMGTAVGPIQASDAFDTNIDMFVYNGNGSKAFSHTMVVGENISTSGDPSMVGADADLYIGTVRNVTVMPMSTIRAVTNDQLKKMAARLGKDNIKTLSGTNVNSELEKYIDYGTVAVIASGLDAKGDTIHLIRDLALGYGPKIQSKFVYSQKQLLTQIIPAKAKEIVDMMYLGTKEEAQAIANRTKKAVYMSLRQPTDSTFAVVNKKVNGKVDGHPYNVTIDKPQPGINYLVVLPKDAKEADYSDEVEEKYRVIKAWADMIAKNEAEKLQAHDKMINYDVAGAAGVNHSETFDASYSSSWSNFFPIATEVDYFELGKGASNAISAATIAGTLASAIAFSLIEMKAWSSPDVGINLEEKNGTGSYVEFAGKLVQWSLFPIASYTSVGADSEASSYNRTETFTIACDPASHLNVDVYRAWYDGSDQSKDVDVYNIFTNDNFNRYYDMVKDKVGKSLKTAKINGPRGFIFRTRGGATQNPWEDQRLTKVYNPGTQLDARTLKICNPKIRLDKQSVSGVAIDGAAKFTVYVGNDSEKPEATDGLTPLQVFALDKQNPQGAKFYINGQVLTTGGMTVTCVPGTETALQMEVRAGQGFDYENLVVGVMSPTDPDNTIALATFDVHFLREAGGLAIAAPGDKWVLNTNAQMDGKRGWYIPVTINGFDRHQHNFDHIEFQYKESQRGDDSWTNLCSFYADEALMAKANGVRELMPENGNIVTQFYGEGWTMERAYDLRAVLFCRNGNDFLTTASKVISGVKDTRRPQLFGTPEPKSGLLTAGDDIVFNFSEDIEYNYLNAITNFEVKGEVNNNSLSELVSVQFNGTTASVESEAKRNFSGKDLTIDLMVKPVEAGRDMPLFSHGTNGQKLQLWLTSDFKLKAVVNDQTLTASTEMPKNIFQQVALVLNQQDGLVTLYHGGLEVGRQKLTSLYTGTGTLIFGRTNEQNRTESKYYQGRMMEARLWYNAMDGTLIGSTYGGHHLTGFEKDLVDYYPMNEGSGDYAKDLTQGANARLMNASWAIPQGLSLHVDKADKGVLLDKNAMNRTAEQDYTLMFWFKTDADGRGTLLSNGRGLREDNGAENQFHIGFEADKLMYRSNGFAVEVPGNWSDGKWHHYAMTVNRGRSVANVYIDKELRTTFEADTLGGISGGYPLIGASRYDVVNEKDTLLRQDGLTPLKGNVDELLFFAQALPQQLISTYATKSPNGDEAGLLTYLSFDRQERQKDNSIELVPYAYSKKLYLDDHGKPRYELDPETKQPTDTLVRDYLFVDAENVVLTHFDKTDAAPVVPYEEVTNLKFSFIGRGNQVLVELDEPNAKLNHRNIYVTLRNIEDLNGNTMASPQTACYYVTNSSLEWVVNRLDYTVKYGSGEVLELHFYNNSSSNHTYKIDNCPKWLTLNTYGDVIAPLGIDYVSATVSKDLNVGTYNEIIYLTDEDGITEPFYLNLTVEGERPEWANSVNKDLLQNSMSISGMVYVNNELDTDSRDIVGVFDNENVCHGFANISHDVLAGETGLYLTVYDSQASGRLLNFRLWQYNTGREIVLTPQDTIRFNKSAVLGVDTPVRFDGADSFVQGFKLKQGWNWVSFNVVSDQLSDLNGLLTRMPWHDGDILTDLGSDLSLVYKKKMWLVSDNVKNVKVEDLVISPKKAYAINVKNDCTFPISGSVIRNEADRTISVKVGWNDIGYTPVVNLSVETALSDYYDQAETGDVIKSHTQFAYFTKSGNVGRWRGNLEYLKPGEGYMLLRNKPDATSFTYPFYELGSTFVAKTRGAGSETAPVAVRYNSCSTMSLSAVVEGISLEEGDRLVAYANGEACGEAVSSADDPGIFYMSIGSDNQVGISFAVERNGEIVASSPVVMKYMANLVAGSPDRPMVINVEPTAISFLRQDAEGEDGDWYNTSGIRLAKKPLRKGVYINNGKKVVIK